MLKPDSQIFYFDSKIRYVGKKTSQWLRFLDRTFIPMALCGLFLHSPQSVVRVGNVWIWGRVQREVGLRASWTQWPCGFLPQEWRLDPLDLVVSLQHHLRDRLPGAPEVLQQPYSATRGPGVCGTEPRGKVCTLSAPGIAILALTVIPVWSVPLQLQFWIRLGLSVASLSVELNDPPLFPAFFNFDQSLGLTAPLGRRGACTVHSAEQFPRDWRCMDSGHLCAGLPRDQAYGSAGEWLFLLEFN